MRIGTRLSLGFTALTLCVVATGLAGLTALRQLRRRLVASGVEAGLVDPVLGTADAVVLGVMAAAVVLAVGLSLYVLHGLMRRLGDLTAAAEHLGADRPFPALPDQPSDEIGAFVRAFDHAVADLHANTVPHAVVYAVFDAMLEMVFVVATDGRIRYANGAATEALGYPDGALHGLPIGDVLDDGELFGLHEGTRFSEQGYIESAERTLRTRDGTAIPVLFSRASLHTGSLRGIVCVAQSFQAQKEVEARLRASLDEKEVLLREIHHRVKNNLQTISSLLELQKQRIDDPAAREPLQESQRRIRSMALIHERLYRSDDLAHVQFGDYLERLAGDLLASYGEGEPVPELRVEADDTALDVAQGIPCALIVNELVSNAVKHAFPDGRPGTVTITFGTTNGHASLAVADDGRGLPADFDPAQSDTLGLRLVTGLAEQLHGRLEVDDGPGARFEITFPLDPTSP